MIGLNPLTMKTILLPDGQQAILFTENPSKQLGIVDVATVKRLAEFLPKASFRDIRYEFKTKLDATNNLAEYISVIADEFNFHTTVNLLTEWKPEQETIVQDEVKV